MTRRTVREWRAYRRLSRNDLAKRLQVHPDTYKRMEDKPELIKVKDALELSKALECQVGEIIFFEQNPNIMLEV